jgi:acyl-CoA synthetase (AMP-forming)/AMP-acid ligase II
MALDEVISSNWDRAPDGQAIEFEGRWFPWRGFRTAADQIDAILASAGAPKQAAIGLIARNRVGPVVGLAALLGLGRCVVMIYSAQSPAGIARDIEALNLAAVVADPGDWTEPVIAAAKAAGTLGLAISGDAANPVRAVEPLTALGASPHRLAPPDVAMELLSSGTTGAPKRIPLGKQVWEAAVADAAGIYAASGEGEPPPGVVFHPISNIAGVTFLIPMLAKGQRVCLIERFSLPEWLDAVARHRPQRASLPPSILQTILDAKVPREALSGFAAIGVGAAPLDPKLQQRFEEAYGVPLLISYGATEFCGVIANWTAETHRKFAAAKRGSVGLPRPGVNLRVVEPSSGEVLAPGEVGVLEAQVERLGGGWTRTTDLASIDDDGFLFLHGRADAAINRGGFKVVPEVVAAALREHPAVHDAAVVGVADARLGAVPVAAVELRPGAMADEAELIAFLRDRVLAYQAPVSIRILDKLPRNASLKADLAAIREIFAI